MHDPDPPMSITISPTREFFEAGGVLVRAWKGADQRGVEIVAMVAGVAVPSLEPMPGLTPVPPPEPDWSDPVRQAMGRMWQAAGRLEDNEAEALTLMAELFVCIADKPHRRELARSFVRDAGSMLAMLRETQ
jgi:hypothetical protein